MFDKLREKRRQRQAEYEAQLEEERRIEKERLMQLSEKELLVELILSIREAKGDIEDKLDDVENTVRIYGN